jgi:hypothetical protein
MNCNYLKTVQIKIFGTKRDVVSEERRKLHNKELNNLYKSHIVKVGK